MRDGEQTEGGGMREMIIGEGFRLAEIARSSHLNRPTQYRDEVGGKNC